MRIEARAPPARRYLKRWFAEWGRDLDTRPDDAKASQSGRRRRLRACAPCISRPRTGGLRGRIEAAHECACSAVGSVLPGVRPTLWHQTRCE
jgi:hypothetical protein